jgi:hypothetical protein
LLCECGLEFVCDCCQFEVQPESCLCKWWDLKIVHEATTIIYARYYQRLIVEVGLVELIVVIWYVSETVGIVVLPGYMRWSRG